MTIVRIFALILTFIIMPSSLMAQELLQTPSEQPDIPKPLQAAVNDGAQTYYLGEYNGLYGWVLIRQGRPEFFYQTKDGGAMVMGILFDGEGEMITAGQLAQLKANEGDSMFAMTGGAASLVQPRPAPTPTPQPVIVPEQSSTVAGSATSIVPPVLTRAQEMFVDLQSANWVTFGANGKHEIFAFIDPDCPHCQQFIKSIKPLVDNGTLKVRALPIGIDPVSEQKAALMLAGSDPMNRFIRYMDGDASALQPPSNINVSAVQKNKSVLLRYNFDVTPIVVYRTNGDAIRIVRGRPQDMNTIIQDITNN